MFVAAWSFDAKYGTRDQVMRLLREVKGTVEDAGWKAKQTRILGGSIGAPESRFVVQHDFETLADLEASWDNLHRQGEKFSSMVGQFRQVIVDGTPRWEIYRVID